MFADAAAPDAWLTRWHKHWARQDGRGAAGKRGARRALRRVDPAIIPRNHGVEEGLGAATAHDDLEPFDRLLDLLHRPFDEAHDDGPYAAPAPAGWVPLPFILRHVTASNQGSGGPRGPPDLRGIINTSVDSPREEEAMMTIRTWAAGLAALLLASLPAFAAEPLMLEDVVGLPGKEVRLVTVESAPGASSPAHRHNGQVFVYVLSGKIIMQVMGSPPVTVGPGQTFYENPGDLHTVSRNASNTEPARFLAFMIVDKGAPISVPVK